MGTFSDLVKKVTGVFDRIAGLCMFSIMLLIVANVILRTVFNTPILGAYEYVVFLTSATIGLSIAHCAFQNGHIAVSFIVDKLPKTTQKLIDITMGITVFVFWLLCSWQISIYAKSLAVNGIVSPTSKMPEYPFVYIVGLGVFTLSLVMLVKIVDLAKELVVFNIELSPKDSKSLKWVQKADEVFK